MRRPVAAILALSLALALGLGAAGCGGGDDGEDLLSEEAVRDCLAEAGLEIEPAALTANPVLGSASPDFRAVTADGVAVDVVVMASERKARRTVADVRAALAGFGASGQEVRAQGNAIVVFDRAPSEAEGAQVEGCLA